VIFSHRTHPYYYRTWYSALRWRVERLRYLAKWFTYECIFDSRRIYSNCWGDL